MKASIRTGLKRVLFSPLRLLDVVVARYSAALESIRPAFGLFLVERQGARIAKRTMRIAHRGRDATSTFTLFTPNALCQYRAETFSTKEPETLDWIDRYGDDGALFDIGANVGLYSIYYAKTKPGNVYAFEPSVFNLALLAKNINANGLESKVKLIVNPLSATNGFADFNLQSTSEGGALSSFGVDYGQDGKPLAKVFSYQVAGFTLDFLLESGIIEEIPSLIKLDVDGIEHLILRGATKTISDPRCKSILVEVNDELRDLSGEVREMLSRARFALEKPREGETVKGSGPTHNQIWIRS